METCSKLVNTEMYNLLRLLTVTNSMRKESESSVCVCVCVYAHVHACVHWGVCVCVSLTGSKI
jgi:hypothetical protein